MMSPDIFCYWGTLMIYSGVRIVMGPPPLPTPHVSRLLYSPFLDVRGENWRYILLLIVVVVESDDNMYLVYTYVVATATA